jgi:hypothetical protein
MHLPDQQWKEKSGSGQQVHLILHFENPDKRDFVQKQIEKSG